MSSASGWLRHAWATRRCAIRHDASSGTTSPALRAARSAPRRPDALRSAAQSFASARLADDAANRGARLTHSRQAYWLVAHWLGPSLLPGLEWSFAELDADHLGTHARDPVRRAPVPPALRARRRGPGGRAPPAAPADRADRGRRERAPRRLPDRVEERSATGRAARKRAALPGDRRELARRDHRALQPGRAAPRHAERPRDPRPRAAGPAGPPPGQVDPPR